MPKVSTVDLNWIWQDIDLATALRTKIASSVEVSDGQHWKWKGPPHANGHGRVTVPRHGTHYVHRVAYIVFVGPIPQDMVVEHKCDIPMCVNPDHLQLGTIRSNSADLAAKGLSGAQLHPESYEGKRRRGPRVPEQKRKIILNDYLTTNMSQREIALKHGVSSSFVNKLVIAHADHRGHSHGIQVSQTS